MRTRVALLAAILFGAAAIPIRGQDAQQPTFRGGVNLVRVDVSVTGRGDEAVADLQLADFEIREDGVPQKVETLQFVRLDGTRTSDLDESLEIRSPEHAALEAARDDVRLFAIFLDDYHIDKKPYVTLTLQRTLKEFVKQFGPNDLVAVMDPLTPLSALKFTRSRDELLARVEHFEGRRGELMPVRSVLEEAQLSQRNVWELRSGVTLSSLEAIVTHLGGLREGRKSVLFVSQGPPLGYIGSPNEQRLKDVLQAANRANVTVHVLDPRPLGSSPLGGADSLQRLYAETGGRAILNSNAPGERLNEIIADASAYYLVGYSPAREMNDGKFHRIDVKVKRPGVRVLARRGYWAPTAEETNAAAESSPVEPAVVVALSELVEPKDGRAADVWVGASRGPDTLTRLTIAWEPTGRPNAKRPSRMTFERVPGRGMTGGNHPIVTINGGGDRTSATLDVEAGNDIVLRFTAEGTDGVVIDQWDETVRVPSLSGPGLTLSTPRFLRARSAFEAQAIQAGRDPAPAASRRFRPTDRVQVEVECYGPDDEQATLTARLLNARGDSLVVLNVPSAVAGKTRFQLPLSSLAPATYVLRIEGHAGDREVQQRTAFRVVP